MTRDELTGLCALHTSLARMDGHIIDKKAGRFTAMADYCAHVLACGSAVFNHQLLCEAVRTAIIGDPMHVSATPFDRAQWRWMEAQP